MKLSNDAQAVIVRKGLDGNPLFLVIKRFDKDKQTDHYRLVKGGVEEGENSAQAVIREIGEEVGIRNIINTELLCHYGYTGGDVRHEVDVYIVLIPTEMIETSLDSQNEGGFTIKSAIWLNSDDSVKMLTFEDEKKLINEAIEKIKF